MMKETTTSQAVGSSTAIFSFMPDMNAAKKLVIVLPVGAAVMYGVLTGLNNGSVGNIVTVCIGLGAMLAGGIYIHILHEALAKSQVASGASPLRPQERSNQESWTLSSSSLVSRGNRDLNASFITAGLTTAQLQDQKAALEKELKGMYATEESLKKEREDLQSYFTRYVRADAEHKQISQVIEMKQADLQTVTEQLGEAYDRQAEALERQKNEISQKRAQITQSNQVRRNSDDNLSSSRSDSPSGSPPPSPKKVSPASSAAQLQASDSSVQELSISGSKQGQSVTFV